MKKQRAKGTVLSVVLICLTIIIVATLAIVFGRMKIYSAYIFQNIIPLTESSDSTKIDVSVNENMNLGQNQNDSDNNININEKDSALKAYDKKKTWKTETEVDIFKVSYQNGKKEITVNGKKENNDKVIAPGTTNKYFFTLENTSDITLGYTLTMEAYIKGTDKEIPVNVCVWDYNQKYLLGSKTNKEDVLKLNNVNEKASLGKGRCAIYFLEWEWPFEWGDDEYDTMLGNLSAQKDITLTVKIKTTASWDKNPEHANAGLLSPKTGQDQAIIKYLMIAFIVAILAAAVTFFLGFVRKRKDDEEKKTKQVT